MPSFWFSIPQPSRTPASRQLISASLTHIGSNSAVFLVRQQEPKKHENLHEPGPAFHYVGVLETRYNVIKNKSALFGDPFDCLDVDAPGDPSQRDCFLAWHRKRPWFSALSHGGGEKAVSHVHPWSIDTLEHNGESLQLPQISLTKDAIYCT